MSEAEKQLSSTCGDAAEAPVKAVSMDVSEVLLLIAAFISALFFWFGHRPFTGFFYGPGIGLTVTHWTLTAAALLTSRRRHILRKSFEGIFLLLLSLLLSAVYGVYANLTLRLLNLPVLMAATAQALFSLTKQNANPALSGQGLWEGFRRFAYSLVFHWGVPFRALKRGRIRKALNAQFLFGSFAALTAGIVALTILSSADIVFSDMISSAVNRAGKIDGTFFIRIILSFMLGMPIFSFLYGLLQKPMEIPAVKPVRGVPSVFSMVLGTLSFIYGVFAYVQIRYLFAGAESVRINGGYAAYARSGFFQLVIVALLTLLIILPALSVCRESKAVRILSSAAALLTAVIDFSAFFRMRLYIAAYGLTTLRVVTLWGIAMILLALLASIAKAWQPAFRICPVLASVVLASWTLLNWSNVDKLVSENLVSRYNASAGIGQDAESDRIHAIESLASDGYWSPDYYAAFRRIKDPDVRDEALALLNSRGAEADDEDRLRRNPPFYDWSLCYLKLPGEASSSFPE